LELVEVYEKMGTEELRTELVKHLSVTAEDILRLAVLIKVLESRGEPIENIKVGLIHHLRRIAEGILLPEALVRFGGRPHLLNAISRMPAGEQKKLADGEYVKMVVRHPGGDFDTRMVDPLLLRAGQLSLVFAQDRVRSEHEQIVMMEDRLKPVARVQKVGYMTLDYERGGVMVGAKFIPQSDLHEALQKLKKTKVAG
jgi:hypothetical protein